MNIINQHEALLADIDGCQLSPGQVALWWMGQHSFILKAGETVIYIDPFLRPMSARRIPPMLSPRAITHASAIVGSHDHLDHIDRDIWPDLADASPSSVFIVPELIRDTLARDLGIAPERFKGLDDGKTVQVGPVRIDAIPAAHEFLDRDPVSGRHPYLGFIFDCGGTSVYHAGDTVIYEGLHQRLRRFNPDVMLLPINGRDAGRYARNCLGNMTFQEAVDLAGELGARFAVPTHWDMFVDNPGDPHAFVDYMKVKYPDVRTRVMGYGQRWIVPATPA